MSGKSPSLRRIKADIRELSIDPSDQYHAAPLEHDMFEWHFTIRGAADTDFAGGIYHGRILLPPEYPFKPPNIVFLTPSGRFETGVKVCLSFSAHHPELWVSIEICCLVSCYMFMDINLHSLLRFANSNQPGEYGLYLKHL